MLINKLRRKWPAVQETVAGIQLRLYITKDLAMPKRRVLVTWIGHNDLRAMAATLAPAKQAAVLADIGGSIEEAELGPTRTLVDDQVFDEIHLLSNFKPGLNAQFCKWIGHHPIVHEVALSNPTDYDQIFRAADSVLQKVTTENGRGPLDLSLHLSPGTPAMAAVWLLLGKSRYPATFFQTYKGKCWATNVPFDLAVDYVPQLLRDADSQLQHLAAHPPSELKGFENIAGNSRPIRLAAGRARQAALRSVPVLILGESGTGKELFARAIHAASPRAAGPFRVVNCAAIPKDLLESELFGHERGAFSGADRRRQGAFEQADGGTLFLDEVGECELSMQAKLLRVLQPPAGGGPCDREFYRLGGSEPVNCNVRVISATNRDLLAAIRANEFRDDLYYRLAVIAVKLPPLRERAADIPKIAVNLLDQINAQFHKEEPGYKDKKISASAMEFVKRHSWPGNVRQLYNALLQSAVMSSENVLHKEDFVEALAEMPGLRTEGPVEPLGDGFNLEEHLNDIHRQYLRRAMQESGGVKTRAARLLGMKNYQTLDAQLKRLGVGHDSN
jgi:DNA-binding NtrC family response regulator